MKIKDKFTFDNDNILVTDFDEKFVVENTQKININGVDFKVKMARLHTNDSISLHVDKKIDDVKIGDKVNF